MNFTPYLTHSISDKDPFEQRYFEPQYDMRDFEGMMIELTPTLKAMLFVPMKMVLTFQSLLMKFKGTEFPIMLET
jgi:hypothetical protein